MQPDTTASAIEKVIATYIDSYKRNYHTLFCIPLNRVGLNETSLTFFENYVSAAFDTLFHIITFFITFEKKCDVNIELDDVIHKTTISFALLSEY